MCLIKSLKKNVLVDIQYYLGLSSGRLEAMIPQSTEHTEGPDLVSKYNF